MVSQKHPFWASFGAVPSLMLLAAGFVLGALLSPVRTLVAQAGPAGQRPSDEYVVLNFMKAAPTETEQYVRLERDTMRPIMQEAIGRGLLKRWAAYEVLWPSGDDREYTHITMDVHTNYSATGPETPQQAAARAEILKKVHPTLTIETLSRQITAARHNPRSQLLRLMAEAR
jgi:hypothetical protein